jgi:DNA-nicking Smr family endonuclease
MYFSTRLFLMIDDDDIDLFHRTVGPVKRLHYDRVVATPRRVKPVPRQPSADELDEPDWLSDFQFPVLSAMGDVLEFQGPGVQHRLMLRLRQGRIAAQRSLDLHGDTALQARQLLPRFLAQARADGLRCVHIVHGKGYRSPERKPVLKALVEQWLRLCPYVLAYCSALPKDGGTGAVYVLLRNSEA